MGDRNEQAYRYKIKKQDSCQALPFIQSPEKMRRMLRGKTTLYLMYEYAADYCAKVCLAIGQALLYRQVENHVL
jgi:hypothetical protein